MPEFTPIQSKMLKILSDGINHSKEELHTCLNDELCPVKNVYQHVTLLRRKLQTVGQDVVCVFYKGRYLYRHVRLLASKYDE